VIADGNFLPFVGELASLVLNTSAGRTREISGRVSARQQRRFTIEFDSEIAEIERLITESNASRVTAAPAPSRVTTHQRRAVRWPFQQPVLYTVRDQDCSGTTVDVSIHGAQIALTGLDLADIGDVVRLHIPARGRQIEIEARVVRRTSKGFGVAFRAPQPDLLDVIADLAT
jgi:c-di-GMP-binding flagellar brake protein YcgR